MTHDHFKACQESSLIDKQLHQTVTVILTMTGINLRMLKRNRGNTYAKKNTCKTISARNLTGLIFVIWFPSRPIPLNEVLGGSQHMWETGNTFHSSTYDISPRKLHVLKSIRLKVMKSIEFWKLHYIIYICITNNIYTIARYIDTKHSTVIQNNWKTTVYVFINVCIYEIILEICVYMNYILNK